MEIDVPQDRKSTFQPQVIKNVRKTFQISTRRLFPYILKGRPPDRFMKQPKIFTVLKLRKDLFLM